MKDCRKEEWRGKHREEVHGREGYIAITTEHLHSLARKKKRERERSVASVISMDCVMSFSASRKGKDMTILWI